MAHEQIDRPFLFGEGLELLHRHDRVTSDAACVKLAIVRVVMVVAPFPNTGRCQNEDAPNGHEHIGQFRILKYCLVLMIMIDDEHPGDRQTRQHAEDDLQPQRCSGPEYAEVPSCQQ